MSPRRARITGVVCLALGVSVGLFALFLVVIMGATIADGLHYFRNADGVLDTYTFVGMLVTTILFVAVAALCLGLGRMSLRQARAGRPLERYALAHEPGTVYLGAPEDDGMFRLRGIDGIPKLELRLDHNKLSLVNGQGIQDVTQRAWFGAYFNLTRLNRRTAYTLWLETYCLVTEHVGLNNSLAVEERRVPKEGPVDDGSRTWGDTRVRLEPWRVYVIPYDAVMSASERRDPWWWALLRGNRQHGLDLLLEDGSTLTVEIDTNPITDPTEVRQARFDRTRAELETLIATDKGGTPLNLVPRLSPCGAGGGGVSS